MYFLILYDICTKTKEGRHRLKEIRKLCSAHGQPIQNSIFECKMDYNSCIELENELSQIIDKNNDSIKFYYLGRQRNLKQFGIKQSYSLEESLVI